MGTVMVMYRGMPTATPQELEHLARVKLLPCCLCLPGEQRSRTEVHHIKRGNKRLGHFYVLPYYMVKHHASAYLYTHQERMAWQKLMDELGLVRDWPLSKVIPRSIA